MELIAIYLGIVLFNIIVPMLAELFCSRPWSNLQYKKTETLSVDGFVNKYSHKNKWWRRHTMINLFMILLWSAFLFTFILQFGYRNNVEQTTRTYGRMVIILLLTWPLLLRLSGILNHAFLTMATASLPKIEQLKNDSHLGKRIFKSIIKASPKYDYYVIGQEVQAASKQVIVRTIGIIITTLTITLFIL